MAKEIDLQPRPPRLPTELARLTRALNKLTPCVVGDGVFVVASGIPPLHRVLHIAGNLADAQSAARRAIDNPPPGFDDDDIAALQIYGPFDVPDGRIPLPLGPIVPCFHECSSEWHCPNGEMVEAPGTRFPAPRSLDDIEAIELRIRTSDGWGRFDIAVGADTIALNRRAFETFVYPVMYLSQGPAAVDELKARMEAEHRRR